ncbi:lysine-specific demethylase JMJ25 isoform X1 [Olea europaea var. sylvestris]|uniref:lysine-specific demethylase JMJ25 isoform X1 n=1 Tax=Olea europaea var. sylvestris TaxID=158386 RepID=UPI000C1D80BD|nr:lysine-specific demethylase JMJ25 isoform X1 [Olea europaea var. sylvestris]
MPEKDLPPDHLRCKRTDGRQWRCSRRALDGLTLCEIHHLQGRHRQKKQKVPDSLKIERSYSKQRKNCEKGGVSKLTKMQQSVEKRKRCQSEALDEALKRMKLRKGDLQLELIRVFLKRQVEKKKERALKESATGETMRVLPNGVMAISHLPLGSQEFSNQNGVLDVKLGVDLNLSLFSQRNFRSKNIEPLPIGTMQVVPFAGSVKKRKIKRCHWCRASNKLSMIKCLSCRKRFFCADCLKERYFERQEVKEKCPACHGTCTCMICQKQQSKAVNHKECPRSKRRVDRNHLLHYLINILLPVLKKINHDQSAEIEIEAHAGNEVQIPQANLGFQNLHCCNCKTSIADYHRSCAKCSYNICLSCLELCRGSLCGGFKLKSCKKKKTCPSDDELLLKINNKISMQSSGGMSSFSPMSLQNWEANADGSVSCPSVDVGGCGNSLLDLRCVFPSTWTRELEVRAEKILCSYHFPEIADASWFCSLCNGIDHKAGVDKTLREVSSRRGSNDNHLYCPTLQGLRQETLEHFQKHWGMGHPVIVQNVLKSTSGLCWDPFTMFCSYIENRSSKAYNEDSVEATNCSDWCEVEIERKQIFMGSLEKRTHASVRHKMLKFKASFSSGLFQKQFPAHYNEILHALPLPHYINPVSGLLNLAVKLPKELQKTDLGPCIYISYGGPEELMQADFLTKLCYESHDTVNILAYATDIPISQEQITKIESLMKKCKSPVPHEQSAGNSTDQKGKSSLQNEGTGELGLPAVVGDRMQLTNGIHSSDSLKRHTLSVEDENMSLDSESDSEESIICCGTIEKSEDTDEYFLAEDIKSSCSSEDKRGNNSCGAQWDIFRRQDVPKLLEYLKRHSNELSHTCYSKHVVHPILDQNFYLDAFHKLKLKEEFDIQPWTFEQQPGEAIIIPAGCPYQIKKLKSCVGVVLDFISPENATQCVKLSDEICLLPRRHKARERLLEVKRMTLHGINAAIEDIYNLVHLEQD